MLEKHMFFYANLSLGVIHRCSVTKKSAFNAVFRSSRHRVRLN